MDEFKIERALAMSNYGVPVHEISFDLNDVVMDAATTNDRILAAIWVSFLPRNAEMTRKALKLAGESRVVALKTTFLLGGNPDPGSWDEETRALADECFDVCEKHDLVFHFHTSPGGNSDITNFIPLVEALRQALQDLPRALRRRRVRATSSSCPKFLQWVQDGYKVYTDTSWAIGFGARWLLTEIERTGRRRRPRVLRLRRAVVGLRQRVLEDQRHPRHLPGAQGARVLAQLRGAVRRPWLSTRPCALDDRRLLVELQSLGVRVEDDDRRAASPGRRGGAGPSDAGFLWVRGLPLTVPMHAEYAHALALHAAHRRRAARACTATASTSRPVVVPPRPRIYDMQTADGVPYWKIALLHLDSIASTVVQKCIYWGTHEQCGFCGIELTRGEQTMPVKTPAQLAEVCTAARDLRRRRRRHADHRLAEPPRPRRALHQPSCAAAIKEACGLPVQVQFEPPDDLRVLDEVHARRRRRGRDPPRDVRPRGAGSASRRARRSAGSRATSAPGSAPSRCSAAGA